jgi:hypothetical protein
MVFDTGGGTFDAESELQPAAHSARNVVAKAR